ncbi:MAG: hypothetical protein FJ303_10595 [Planctomycetes bacterium]|nr:hypothetical protein [Planctomycetota bacterium]
MNRRANVVLTTIILAACWGCAVDARKTGAVCPVHNVALQDDRIKIAYGLVRTSGDEADARNKLFPHAATRYLGGCEVYTTSPSSALVSFRSECRKAEAAWKKQCQAKLDRIYEHDGQIHDVLGKAAKFKDVESYVSQSNGPAIGLRGKVKAEEDLAELRRMIEATKPPAQIQWHVRVEP